MSKKSRLMSIVLVLTMLVPMFSAFTLGATAVTYAEAQDGDLLHSFDKDTSFVADSTDYIDGKNGGTFDWNADGTGATLKQTKASSSLKWGGTLVDNLPLTDGSEPADGNDPAIDAKYTFVFNLTLNHSKMVFGILVDGGAGFVIRGDGEAYWLSSYASYKDNTGDWNGYEGCSDTGKQTFAVEFDVKARKYTIYTLKSDNTWHNGGSIANSAWNYDHEYMTLGFFAMAINGTSGTAFNTLKTGYESRTAKFSDLKIYKGVGLTSKFTEALNAAAEEEARIAAEKLQAAKDNYALLADGAIAYTANFNGTTDVWAPSTEAASEAATEADGAGAKNPFESTTINSENKITFSVSGSNGARAWGADVQNLPYGNGFNYTVKFKYERTANIPLAFFIDSVQGFYIYTDKVYARHNNSSDNSSKTEYSGINGKNPSETRPSVQEFAIQIDGTNETYTLFAKNARQRWTEILTWNDKKENGVFFRDYLGLYFYANNTDPSGSVAVSDLVVYKGISTLAAENTVLDEEEARIFNENYGTALDNDALLEDGELIETVDFDAEGWNPDFADDNNLGADVAIENDGAAVTLTIQNENNKRAMWGDTLLDLLPVANGFKYTFVFDLTFGNADVGFAIYPENNNGLVIFGDGTTKWYEWNSPKADGANWADVADVDGMSQTFAVELDVTAKTYTLYVKTTQGFFAKVTSVTYDDAWGDDYKALMSARLYVRTLSGDAAPDATYTATVANLSIYKGNAFVKGYELQTQTGASVRFDDPTGLRFTGLIGKTVLDELKNTYGEENVKLGMFITPTNYLTDNELKFTMADLDACDAITGPKYTRVDAATILDSDDGTAYLINCVLSNIKTGNYGREYSAITFVEVNGELTYAGYNAADHSRSVAFVAQKALEDLSGVQENEYQNEVTVELETKYSPYTDAERAILSGFVAD